ncbi:MAG: hypothetical protein U1F43_30630 [Myxococcota bacterium]
MFIVDRSILSASLLSIGLYACASAEGTAPHDHSAAEHDQEAAREEVLANEHAAHYDPSAERERTVCKGILSRAGSSSGNICWSSTTNPTAEHQAAADAHRKIAAEHRAASQALRDAEAKACAGLADDERDMSPFDHTEDIASVASLREAAPRTKYPGAGVLKGATVDFVAVPGMTAEWLQRVVDCHIARNAVMGHDDPAMPQCPLVPNGVTATVTSNGAGFAVAIRSDDPEVAQEILRRARGLIQAPTPTAMPDHH